MFTGIISHVGTFSSKKDSVLSLKVPASLLKELKAGSSVAVNGVCLTVRGKGSVFFEVEVMPETLRRTNLGDLEAGHLVNLELAMKADGRFEGHMVQGHVDGAGVINTIKKEGNSRIFTFKIEKELGKYIVEKGSVAVNGISLTVIKSYSKGFSVGIIPYTWENTMMREAKIGDKVNIEVDILAKYLEKLKND